MKLAEAVADELHIMVKGRMGGDFIDIEARPNAATTIMMTTIGRTLRPSNGDR